MELHQQAMSWSAETVQGQSIGDDYRHVIFSPTTTGNSFQKLAYLDIPPGTAGVAHLHLGDEVMFTLKGSLILTIDGSEHLLTAGTAFLVPPDVPHLARVVGDEHWIAVCAYCDECPVLKVARGRIGVEYPLMVPPDEPARR